MPTDTIEPDTRDAVLVDLARLLNGGLEEVDQLSSLQPERVRGGHIDQLRRQNADRQTRSDRHCRHLLHQQWNKWTGRLRSLHNRPDMLRSDLVSMAGGSDSCRLKVSRKSADPAGYGTLTLWQYERHGHTRPFVHRTLSLYAELKALGHRITRQRGDAADGDTCHISRVGWLFAPTDHMDTIRQSLRRSLLTDTWSGVDDHQLPDRELTMHGDIDTPDLPLDPEDLHSLILDDSLDLELADLTRNLWLITHD